MIIELDILDHAILDEDNRCMVMFVFDLENIWLIEKQNYLNHYRYNRLVKEKNNEHLIYLKRKIENYVDYVQNNGLLRSFSNCVNPELYKYEIKIITDFIPSMDYLNLIEEMNNYLTEQLLNILITTEKNTLY